MKKLLLLTFFCLAMFPAIAQVAYYKGEWTMVDKHDLFTGIFKIEIKNDGTVTGQLAWTYLETDSTDDFMLTSYKGKKGKQGLEFVEGKYAPSTHDIYFEGKDKSDPYEILGLDKYTLKYSADKQVIYGTTATEGTNKGLFYAIKMNNAAGAAAFNAAKMKVKNKTK